ncbi:MAG: hypothetical protein H0T78_07630 [Longispora sp.]|nr:hypothetical protein [Longispora sp. (in: high G+C Gram-positive bacteria)]
MRRFLTAAVTLGAITAGLLGTTAPAHAMKRACEAEVITDPDVATDPCLIETLPDELWGVICANLPEASMGQLGQVDKKRDQRIAGYRASNLHTDAGVVYAHTSEQLADALRPNRKPEITHLGIAMALTAAEQTLVTGALDAETLSFVGLYNGATLPTVAKGTVRVGHGGSVTTVVGGQVDVRDGGTITTVSGGKVDVGIAGIATTVTRGHVVIRTGGIVTTVNGGRVNVSLGGTVTTVNGGNVQVHAGATVTTDNGGDTRAYPGSVVNGITR